MAQLACAAGVLPEYFSAYKSMIAGYKHTYTHLYRWANIHPLGSDEDADGYLEAGDVLKVQISRAKSALAAVTY